MIRRVVTTLLLFVLLIQSYSVSRGCGPSYLQPIFSFESSPDLPFTEFTAGKIGIVKPTFGRKTLVIAYRYLNGGSFSPEEQQQLVSALHGEGPEPMDDAALKAWIAMRKELMPQEELPEIYLERKTPFESYDYFPNCTNNAFEVATATLKDRAASYGSDDRSVREWVRGQDEVFQNCSGGSATIPRELGAEAPPWLRKDRNYQIAAAYFYSLQFEEALSRFEKIAADGESAWQSTADYLVARTLVRQASLTDDASKKSAIYEKAEDHLGKVINGNSQFRGPARKLLGLVKYRIHPQERVTELAEVVSRPGLSFDAKQDVTDYVWLLGKFEGEVLKKEHERQEALKAKPNRVITESGQIRLDTPYDQIQRGELIAVYLMPKMLDGSSDYRNEISLQVKPETPESEILRLVEERLTRPLSDEESKQVKDQIKNSLNHRRWLSSFNLKVSRAGSDYESCPYCYDLKFTFPEVPSFLLKDDLTDWIFTVGLDGPGLYEHAWQKWHETDSSAWLIAALIKAEPTSANLKRLMNAADGIVPDSAAYPTVVFHLVRLKAALGETAEAQRLLEKITSTQTDLLPLSAQNEFQVQRLQLARNLSEFLKYAARKPVAFYDEGLYLSIRELIDEKKSFYSDYEPELPKEQYEARLEDEYRDLLSADLKLFDDHTADIVDRHFSLRLLQQAASDPQISTFLRRRLMLAAWTRTLLLRNYEAAIQLAPKVTKAIPEIAPLVKAFVEAKNAGEREHAGLYLLLKSPGLTPFISADLTPRSTNNDQLEYYFESAWWCAPSETEYRDGKEVRKVVSPPPFIDTQNLAEAKQEFEALAAIGDAKTFLGEKVLEWARSSPGDPRIPEALFITFRANESYKYGCSGWEHDEELKSAAEELLSERYATSSWAAKLRDSGDR
jgi:hypothetical protein